VAPEKGRIVEESLPEAYVIACLVHGDGLRALDLIEEFGPLPQYAPHLAAAAGRLLADGQDEAGRQLAARAVELDDQCALAHSVIGRVLTSRNERSAVAAAEAALRRAAELDPHELPARVALVLLYLRQERLLEALPYIEEAVAAAPWDEGAREALKRLRKALEIALKSTPDLSLSPDSHNEDEPPSAVTRQQLADAASRLRRLAADAHHRCAAARPPSLSLCLITRNEAHNLPRVIGSVCGLATEVIVVDTGSTDTTVKIARRLGARVDQFTWIDDFAAARNHSLKLATGEWILVLDADDEMAGESVPALREWLRYAPDVDVVGLYRRYSYPGMSRDSVSVQPRLFRNGRGLHYEGAIHERLVRADGQPAQPAVTLTVTHHHHGIDSREAVFGRHARNLPILLRSLEQDPDDIRTLYYVGTTHFEKEEWDQAVSYLRASIERAGKEIDLVRKTYGCLGFALFKAGKPLDAERVLREGLEWYPYYPDLWFCLGLVLDSLGRLEEAADAHEAALRGRYGPGLNWHDWTTREEKPHIALCELRLSLGDLDAASRHLEAAERFTGPKPQYATIRQAIEQSRAEKAREAQEQARRRARLEQSFSSGDVQAGVGLTELALEAGETERAVELTHAWIQKDPGSTEAWVARGMALLASGSAEEALASFQKAAQMRPDPGAWRGQANAFRALARAVDAERALRHALALDPEDGQTEQQLGELYLAQQRWDEAAGCFQRSLERQDDRWSAWLGLGNALLRVGNLPVAINCYQRAATLSGGNLAVRVALGEARACLSPPAAS
jgi:tetratricopeptide (TPR) repeat protein